MILTIRVYCPEIISCSQDVPGRHDGSKHRMILVVVFVHPVPAHELQVWYRTKKLMDSKKTVFIVLVVHRIRLGHAAHGPVYRQFAIKQPEPFYFALGQL